MNRAPLFALLLFACATPQPAVSPAPAPAPVPTPASPSPKPPSFRLGDDVRPVRYAAALSVDPSQQAFSGRVEIDLDIARPTSVVWLNGTDLKIDRASLKTADATLAAKPVPGGDDFVGFQLERDVSGKATLSIEYRGTVYEKESNGLFRQEEGGHWYAFTDVEPLDARRIYPCFDEPAFKVPWQLTLEVPEALKAFANTPVENERVEGVRRIVRFAETKPLPTYLVAFAVGPFDVVDAGRWGQRQTPVRIIVPKGRQAEAEWAAKSTGPILEKLEAYFGSPYPYEKVDLIAVPLFGGAMENPGLTTFGSTLILARPGDDSIRRQRSFANVCAHELAHMWFGDLVTMAWWDDLWLNEAFATWMASRVVHEWKPEWQLDIERVASQSAAMGNDSLVSARRIRQPIETNDDIRNAFDGITYGKGAAVLRMFEQYVGAEKFQNGVRRYLAKHAWGNATAADFLAAVSAEAGQDVAPAFTSFLEQVGVPLVSYELRCDAGQAPKLLFEQRRYLPVGSKGSASQVWRVPVCVRWTAGKQTARTCTLLAEPTAELPLPEAKKCPDRVVGNDGYSGYYRAFPKGNVLKALLADRGRSLSVAERVGFLGDLGALVRSGDVDAQDALTYAASLAGEDDRHVVAGTAGLVAGLKTNLVPDELVDNYARFVRKTFGARARALGFEPKPKEDDDTRLLRATLLEMVGDAGRDAEIRKRARALLSDWVKRRDAIHPDLVEVVIELGALDGDRALFDELLNAAKREQSRKDRQRLLFALASMRDPKLNAEALELTLSDAFDVRESIQAVWVATSNRETREQAYRFVKQHYDELVRRLPRDYAAYLAFSGTAMCDEKTRADAEAFFGQRTSRAPGGPRILAQALEQLELCVAVKQRQQPSVAAFLKKQ